MKINADKSVLMLVHKPKFNISLNKFTFNAENYIIKAKNTIKILGIYIRKDLKYDAQIGRLCSNLHNWIHEIRKISMYTNFKTRLTFIKSYVIGKLMYAMPIYMGINNILTTKIHKVIMAGARAAIGNYCFRKSIYYILNKCDILDAKERLLVSALNFMYKLNYNKGPESILTFFYPEREIKLENSGHYTTQI